MMKKHKKMILFLIILIVILSVSLIATNVKKQNKNNDKTANSTLNYNFENINALVEQDTDELKAMDEETIRGQSLIDQRVDEAIKNNYEVVQEYDGLSEEEKRAKLKEEFEHELLERYNQRRATIEEGE